MKKKIVSNVSLVAFLFIAGITFSVLGIVYSHWVAIAGLVVLSIFSLFRKSLRLEKELQWEEFPITDRHRDDFPSFRANYISLIRLIVVFAGMASVVSVNLLPSWPILLLVALTIIIIIIVVANLLSNGRLSQTGWVIFGALIVSLLLFLLITTVRQENFWIVFLLSILTLTSFIDLEFLEENGTKVFIVIASIAAIGAVIRYWENIMMFFQGYWKILAIIAGVLLLIFLFFNFRRNARKAFLKEKRNKEEQAKLQIWKNFVSRLLYGEEDLLQPFLEATKNRERFFQVFSNQEVQKIVSKLGGISLSQELILVSETKKQIAFNGDLLERVFLFINDLYQRTFDDEILGIISSQKEGFEEISKRDDLHGTRTLKHLMERTIKF